MMPISGPVQGTRVAPLTANEEAGLRPPLLASSPDGIAFIDPREVVRVAGEALAGQAGLPRKRLLGRPAQSEGLHIIVTRPRTVDPIHAQGEDPWCQEHAS